MSLDLYAFPHTSLLLLRNLIAERDLHDDFLRLHFALLGRSDDRRATLGALVAHDFWEFNR